MGTILGRSFAPKRHPSPGAYVEKREEHPARGGAKRGHTGEGEEGSKYAIEYESRSKCQQGAKRRQSRHVGIYSAGGRDRFTTARALAGLFRFQRQMGRTRQHLETLLVARLASRAEWG